MNQPLDLEVSLYELAQTVAPSSSFVQTSPATFRALLSSLIGLLIENKLPATLWAKLPHASAWQTELKQYCELVNVPRVVYLLSSHKEDAPVDEGVTGIVANSGAESATVASEEIAAQSRSTPVSGSDASSEVVSLQLPANTPLRSDYFLLVGTDSLCALILAHHPKPLPASSEGMAHESPDRKQLLQVLCSFDQALIQAVFAAIQQAINTSNLSEIIISPLAMTLDQLFSQWQSQFANLPQQTDATLVEQLFAKQVQRQEELWARMTAYRKQAETIDALNAQNQELLNTIRFKDEFLNNVGQELRTPLTNMKTALTLLNSPSLKPPQRQRYMDLLSQECDRQSSLITSLLELVRLEQVAEQATFQPLRLSEIVPGVVSTYQPLAEEKGIQLAYTVPDDLPSVSCMNDWLKQIVINLLHNGIKFTPRGGQVWVRAKQQGDYVQLEFRDNGIGIAPSEISKIFDRFYRVRQPAGEEVGGVGLGLTIVQQLLFHSSGSISVKSKLGEGSTFNVLLPIYKNSTDTLF
ncbi:MAG: histidine kinase [Scytolyngbya sp. HA4215-MV1]|jgi:signal transduction histidine kinase|nr:histidine kinase [Scytolyngbya sp. HA4215-MV1]